MVVPVFEIVFSNAQNGITKERIVQFCSLLNYCSTSVPRLWSFVLGLVIRLFEIEKNIYYMDEVGCVGVEWVGGDSLLFDFRQIHLSSVIS